ncbi:MAG: cache domain-containing protein, partial [Desulfobacterales bacterium]|nr:cache domain-containing protein [Desulfobacterales bacterium]
MRADYIRDQRAAIRNEVDRVTHLINHETGRLLADAKRNIQSRVNEAHAIAWHIYEKNRDKLPGDEIQKQIIAALRPIRFDHDQGYYFINGFDGSPRLFADRPENEGRNLLDLRDARGQYVIRDMIRIIREKKEGFYAYVWTKPGRDEN